MVCKDDYSVTGHSEVLKWFAKMAISGYMVYLRLEMVCKDGFSVIRYSDGLKWFSKMTIVLQGIARS